ncbi:hypothetical protein [Hymenobacter lucidus]|uniref:Uncharacterized protein n=1 Tax=Hymenobacter lucidus TaxID=2880930 RepID=A0ABS8AT59_9BACT|nr:hypothetical protein [Hymenobacter lucidus]MCB2409405.1 hypothetical protein [Hymenobacter lucidus]
MVLAYSKMVKPATLLLPSLANEVRKKGYIDAPSRSFARKEDFANFFGTFAKEIGVTFALPF